MSPFFESLSIRQVTQNDLDACFTLESICFLPSEAASRNNIRTRIENYPEGFLVAEYNGSVIGHINSGSCNQNDITDENFKALVGHDSDGSNNVVFSLAVLPEFQGKGIAQQLLSRFAEISRANHKRKILLLCKVDLRTFYQKQGFISLGQSASTHGGFTWYEMEKILTHEGGGANEPEPADR